MLLPSKRQIEIVVAMERRFRAENAWPPLSVIAGDTGHQHRHAVLQQLKSLKGKELTHRPYGPKTTWALTDLGRELAAGRLGDGDGEGVAA